MPSVYIVDKRYYNAFTDAFGTGDIFLPSVCCPELAEPVSCHPDMALFAAGGTVICAPSAYQAYRRILSPFGVKLVQGKTNLSRYYPNDIAYNVLNAADCAFARWDRTEEQIRSLLDRRGIRRVPVRQGYSRCAALAVGDGVITADPGIGAAAQQSGLAVLLIRPGHVLLPGYDCGFIGGASGIVGSAVVFFGGLDTHPDAETMRAFITARGFSIRDLPGRPLIDIGTVFAIEVPQKTLLCCDSGDDDQAADRQ